MSNLSRKLMMGAAGAAGEKLYVEDVFSTWLYTGNGSTQTITNGIDLSGKGGLVWIKPRNGAYSHRFYDTTRGAGYSLRSDQTAEQVYRSTDLTSFSSSGFTLGSNPDVNDSGGATFASWTFRKAAKFFDVVTYTGNGTTQNIAHNLGSVPGVIIVKRTDSTGNWLVYHRSLSTIHNYLLLNSTATVGGASAISPWPWGATAPTNSQFSVGFNSDVNVEFQTNANGASYVAYLFAHDAGGFGDSGNESVVRCGSYTGNGSSQLINLGWEPQWVLIKNSTSTGSWYLVDSMRDMPATVNANQRSLSPNTSVQEVLAGSWATADPQGFRSGSDSSASGQTYIYIAIRRGPMKTPTDATKVFATATGADSSNITSGFPVDLGLNLTRGSGSKAVVSRLTGTRFLETQSTAAESAGASVWYDSNTQFKATNLTATSCAFELFRRAPGFFDVVAYTGTGSARTVPHNLGVAPELMIVKERDNGGGAWDVYSASTGNTKVFFLNTDAATTTTPAPWNNTSPTSSVFTVGSNNNTSPTNYIAYLFASCPGVSKVGSYTGTGTTLNVDCGFTAGARFVLIKRTDSTGDWYVWDTARGIFNINDPYLLLNSMAAEVTSTDYIDPLSSGFQISSTAPAAINASGGTFIFLAIA